MMYTFQMDNGDWKIGETGQLKKLTSADKLRQDIAEALNSEYDVLKKFGGDLVTDKLSTKNEVTSEIYKILDRLMDTQSRAEGGEKIKSIDEVTVVQQESAVYAYISVVSFTGDTVDDTYQIL